MHKKIYIVIIAILFLLASMVANLIFGQSSLPRQQEVKDEIAQYQAQIESLQAVIEGHKQEIDRLQNDSLYKEKILRTRYGMSKDGEKVYQMVK